MNPWKRLLLRLNKQQGLAREGLCRDSIGKLMWWTV